MSRSYTIFIWKRAPFLRLLVPVIVGILLQYYFQFSLKEITYCFIVTFVALVLFSVLPLAYRFKFSALLGIIINILIINFGWFITWNKDIRNHTDWYLYKCNDNSLIVATIIETPVEKNKSFKAIASINNIINGDTVYPSSGKLLLYFSKDSSSGAIQPGDKIILKNKLQDIKNSGNPAAFNYKRYCAFQQIFQQAYLKTNDWKLNSKDNISIYQTIKYKTQQYILNTIDKYITGNNEVSIAKALLIGYKVDLDKDLVQQYSNAGVIHIIVIAGLHLGLIYALLLWILNRIPKIKNAKYTRLVIILICLWCFALLTGASPPVMRAVIMFSSIQIGRTVSRNSSVYNSLAASAFILLCIDPFSLWDVGFQLSYLAVSGIVILHKYIYHWLYIRNKMIRKAWNIASVSLAAQIFTMPACLYYFHQIPLLFMVTNIVAVPLAMIALYGCVALICLSSLSIVAIIIGKVITVAIWLMNQTVFIVNNIPFSIWNDFSVSIVETFLLYAIIISLLFWLIQKNKTGFKIFVAGLFVLSLIIFIEKFYFFSQRKIIVYEVPNHKAIDFIDGNTYHFAGDSSLVQEDILKNFHLKPARIYFHCNNENNSNFPIFKQKNFYQFYDKRLLIIDSAIIYKTPERKINVDYIILSNNAKVYISSLAKVFNCDTYIFDASNPLWKIAKWKKDCEDLHLRSHSVPEQGAFIKDL